MDNSEPKSGYSRQIRFLKTDFKNGKYVFDTAELYVYEDKIVVKKTNRLSEHRPFEELPTIPQLEKHLSDFILRNGYRIVFHSETESKLYTVEVYETLHIIVQIEATSADQAETIAKEQWDQGIYVLDKTMDFYDIDFSAQFIDER